MAPTEILADQHAEFYERLGPLGIKVRRLSGETKGIERKTVLDDLKENRASIVIGTHASSKERNIRKAWSRDYR